MQENKRRFFRMNVKLPFYIQSLDADLLKSARIAIPSQTDAAFKLHQSQLKRLFTDVAHINNGAVDLFSSINDRLDFFIWLLDLMIQQKDPRQQADYYSRLDRDRLISLPQGNGKSSVFPLIHALFYRVDEMIEGLIRAVEHSVNQHVFLLTRPVYASFDGARYLHNLEPLAQKGNWLAQVLQQLIFKLNIYEQAYSDLKDRFHDLSYPERWLNHAVNLSSGGLAFETEQTFKLKDQYCILLQLDEHIIYTEASVVAINPLGNDDNAVNPTPQHRVAFEFQQMSADNQSQITQFVTARELASAHSELK